MYLKRSNHATNQTVGFISLCASFSLYAGGEFGIIQELYVLEDYRPKGIGKGLLSLAFIFAKENAWRRLEVATPPLPQFDRSLQFYLKNGFESAGGKKLKK